MGNSSLFDEAPTNRSFGGIQESWNIISQAKKPGDHPAVNVTWFQCLVFYGEVAGY